MLKPLPRTTLLLALVLGLLVNPAWASGDRPVKGLVIFGDSLSDPGNAFVLTGEVSVRPFKLIPDAPYLIGGLHLSNGKTWVEQLAADLDLPRDARPAFLAPGFFSNYAVGAARARGNGPIDLTSQVAVFLSVTRHERPDHRLYVLWVGGNDVRDAFAALTEGASPARARGIIRVAVTAITDNMAALVEAGARRFLVLNAPNIGLVPAVTLFGPERQPRVQWSPAPSMAPWTGPWTVSRRPCLFRSSAWIPSRSSPTS
jgi:phospholipase/lecithinase/hemolysin